MKRVVAAALTIVVMSLLIWSGQKRQAVRVVTGTSPSTSAAPDPAEVRLTTLLDCAWRGDVAGYLKSFGGPLRERLEREVNERGRETFAADLKQAARSRKSHAIFAVEPEGEAAARITVETVYPDRNERQTYHLAQEGGGWLVNDVETIRSQVPKARYGTPASYQEPEGVPVQGLAVQGIPLRVETNLAPQGQNPATSAAGATGAGTADGAASGPAADPTNP